MTPTDPKELKILESFDGNLRLEQSGAEISKKTGLWSGNLYPALLRMEDKNLLKSRWEEAASARRRLYSLDNTGYNEWAAQRKGRGEGLAFKNG